MFTGIKHVTIRCHKQPGCVLVHVYVHLLSTRPIGTMKGCTWFFLAVAPEWKQVTWWLFCVRMPADGEDNRGACHGSLGVQPRPDQRCRHAATRQPESGGEAAVDVSRSQLDPPTVRWCNTKCISDSLNNVFVSVCSGAVAVFKN